ncbi:MAG: ABC transporter permease [Aestuariivirga sp.]|uniref:ABC transporter permease n=1 Tax=Aestuariivirga sp. TaxID=2650926 RepID=UPI0025BC946F|nr:ABC transporter permease [Aestuariivirga sp.]MCA3562154.1 ABC transporter permease [Aestuariivirga sp.]
MTQSQEFEKTLEQSDSAVAHFRDGDSAIRRFQQFLHTSPAAVPLIVLILSVAIFGVLVGGKFFNAYSLTLIIQQITIVGIVGAAQALIILTAGIDLSVGAVMVLSAVVMGQFTFRYGIPVPVSILCGLACGTLCGFINGWLVAVMRLPPFIVTLGTWQVFNSIKYIYSRNETIRGQDIEAQAPLLQLFGAQINIGGAVFTLGVAFMFGLVLLLWYVLNYTAWGRRLYAVGDDPDAAELSGVPVKRMLITVYTLAGLICGMAGWVLIGRIGSVSPTSGEFANIESITAVVIGGMSLFGGRGSILGMIFGALIVGVFSLGLRLYGADAQWTWLLIGVLIIGAVAVDQWIRKVAG